MRRRQPDTIEKFVVRQDRSEGPEACWLWLGNQSERGSPRIWWKGRQVQARRTLWEEIVGKVPAGRTVGVTCKHPTCMNPKHFRLRALHDDTARFWENVQKGTGCWEWTGSLSKNGGYGVFQLADHSTLRASRHSWELHHGPIGDPDVFVCHHCDNPKCVRPEHLFLGTALDNTRDMIAKGRAGWQRQRSA